MPATAKHTKPFRHPISLRGIGRLIFSPWGYLIKSIIRFSATRPAAPGMPHRGRPLIICHNVTNSMNSDRQSTSQQQQRTIVIFPIFGSFSNGPHIPPLFAFSPQSSIPLFFTASTSPSLPPVHFITSIWFFYPPSSPHRPRSPTEHPTTTATLKGTGLR